MSQENVEVVRRAVNAMNQRDLDGVMRDTDAEVEVIGRGPEESRQASTTDTKRAGTSGAPSLRLSIGSSTLPWNSSSAVSTW